MEVGLLTAAIATLTVGAGVGVQKVLGAELTAFLDDLQVLIGS